MTWQRNWSFMETYHNLIDLQLGFQKKKKKRYPHASLNFFKISDKKLIINFMWPKLRILKILFKKFLNYFFKPIIW